VGQGVVFTSTVRELRKLPGVSVAIAEVVIRPDRGASDSNFSRKPLSKWTTLRALSPWGARPAERRFLAHLNRVSVESDVAVWFGSAYDPLTLQIPDFVRCPVWFHVNDSITLYEKSCRRGAVMEFIAQMHERHTLQAGYAGVVYVSADDYAAALKLPATSPRHLLPIGVDGDAFAPGDRKTLPNRVLFTGNMGYPPNVDAALYIIREIAPRLRSSVEVILAGAEPAAAIILAASACPNVKVTGRVTNLVSLYQSARVMIAPMFTGSGIKIKILEAMSCGVPVVTTTQCMAAFPVPQPPLIVAGDPHQFCTAIDNLVSDGRSHAELSARLRSYSLENFSWSSRTRRFLDLVSTA
jgi:glycosyltransferase involved in cell wall biosynthesis